MSVPAAAKAHSVGGAKAFARYYFEAVGRAYTSADPSEFQSLALPACVGCGALVRAVEKLREEGHHTDKASLDIKLVQVRSGGGDRYRVDVAGNERPVHVLDKKNQIVETSKPGVFTFATQVVWNGGHWRIADFEVL